MLYIYMCHCMLQRGAKVQRIIDVWEAGQGVISLHVFQNVIPVEAYTREACIIDAFGKIECWLPQRCLYGKRIRLFITS